MPSIDLQNISGTQAVGGATLIGLAVAGGNRVLSAVVDGFKGKEAVNNKHFDMLVEIQRDTTNKLIEIHEEAMKSRVDLSSAMNHLTHEIHELRAVMPVRHEERVN
jgi:hypothetical protein